MPSTSTVSDNTSTRGLSRDPFGFRQIIVAATKFGKVYGIDSSSGVIVWSRILGLPKEVDGEIIPLKLHVTKTVSDGGNPEVVLVAQRTADDVCNFAGYFDMLTQARQGLNRCCCLPR